MNKDSSMQRVVLVTGGSAGLGAALISRLIAQGWRVYAGSRRGTVSDGVADKAHPLRLDVTDERAYQKAVATILAECGHLDAIVCNAGINIGGPAEELTREQAAAVLDTNFWGVVNGIRSVLPHFRSRRTGSILVIGSLAGMVAPPGASYYAASKHAVLGFLESFQYEVSGFGIRVNLIEPGFIRTDLATSAEPNSGRIADYDTLRSKLDDEWRESIHKGMEANHAAQRIVDVLENRSAPFRVRLGQDAIWLPRLKALMPTNLFLRVTRNRFGLD